MNGSWFSPKEGKVRRTLPLLSLPPLLFSLFANAYPLGNWPRKTNQKMLACMMIAPWPVQHEKYNMRNTTWEISPLPLGHVGQPWKVILSYGLFWVVDWDYSVSGMAGRKGERRKSLEWVQEEWKMAQLLTHPPKSCKSVTFFIRFHW